MRQRRVRQAHPTRHTSARWIPTGRRLAAAALVVVCGLVVVAGATAGLGTAGVAVPFSGGPKSSPALALVGAPAAGRQSPDESSPPSTAPSTPTGVAAQSHAPADALTPAEASSAPQPTPIPPVPSSLRQDPHLAQLLQAQLNTYRAKGAIPGVSVAILHDSGWVWLGVSGQRDVAAKQPMTVTTGFGLASVSKTFVAAVVLELVNEGRFTLDTPVAPLLPGYGLDARITVRMLLDHTSGLPDFYGGAKIDAALLANTDAVWTPAHTWSFLPAGRGVPGTWYTYSNANYLLLGEVIRVVTGNAPAVEIRRRLLDPLGLTNTWYQDAEPPRVPLSASYSLAWKWTGEPYAKLVAGAGEVMPFRSVVTSTGAAGSMASTAYDAARWIAALAGGHVLPQAMLDAMLADERPSLALGAPSPYGLGISTIKLAGHFAIGHSGRLLGVRTLVRYLPDEHLAIAVLSNQGDIDPTYIASALLQVVLPPSPTPSPSASGAP